MSEVEQAVKDEEVRKSVEDILNATNGDTLKFRDLVGQTLTITGIRTVQTKNGDTVVFSAKNDDDEEMDVWAPSVVAKQLQELHGFDWLPIKLTLWKATSKNGNDYFTLVDPERTSEW